VSNCSFALTAIHEFDLGDLLAFLAKILKAPRFKRLRSFDSIDINLNVETEFELDEFTLADLLAFLSVEPPKGPRFGLPRKLEGFDLNFGLKPIEIKEPSLADLLAFLLIDIPFRPKLPVPRCLLD
jgi:sulfur carrier protein ThiS